MKYVYTAIFSLEPKTKSTYNVHFPDLPGCLTFGDNLEEAITMAKDVLCLWLYDMEQGKADIPLPTPPAEINVSGSDFITAIAIDTDNYRRYFDNQSVKKTLTIPMWLNQRAEDANVNFSQTLQKALKEELNVGSRY